MGIECGNVAAHRARQLLLTSASAAAILAASSDAASAQTWTGTTSNDWTIGSNWSGGVAPTNGTVTIEATSPNPTVVGVGGAANATSGQLYVGRTSGGSGNLTIQNGSTLTGSNYARVGENAGSSGAVTVTGAGSNWVINNVTVPGLIVGNFGTGRLDITNGGSVVTDAIYVGRANTGILNITGGGTLTTTGSSVPSSLGRDAGGNALVTVSGAGSAWTLGGTSDLVVGSSGSATLNIQNGGQVVSASGVKLGDIAGSSGVINLASGGTLETSSLVKGTGAAQANFDGGILRATANNASFITGFTGTQLNIASGGLTLDTQAFNVTATAPFSGVGHLTKTGTGALTLTNNASSFSGGTTISQGTLIVGSNGASGSGTVTLGNASTGANDVALRLSYPNFLGGKGPYANDIVVSALGTGTVSIGSTVFNPGANGTIFGGTITLNRDVTLVGGSTDRTTFQGRITGTGNVTVTGNRITLSNSANDFVGDLTIASGNVLQTDRAYVLPRTATLNILGNGVLQFSNTSHQTIDGLNGSSSAIMRIITGAPPMLAVGAANGSGDYAGQIGNVISSFSKLGTGTQVLSGANTYRGPTTISGGVLSTPLLANGGAASGIGASSNVASNLILNGGTLRYTGVGASTNRAFTLGTGGGGLDASGSGAVNFTNTTAVALDGLGSRTLMLTGSSTAANMLGATLGDNGGPSSIVKSGIGTWMLTGNNSYTGSTIISAGTLALSGAGSIARSAGVIADGTFDISAVTPTSASIQSLAGDGAVTLGAKTLTITAANDTFLGRISGTGGLTIAGGTQTLSGPNNYSGMTSIASGATLRAGAAHTFSAASAHNVLSGGTFDLAGFNQTIASLDNAGTARTGGAPGTTLTVTGNYAGNGGTLELNSRLGNDASVTDRLVVQGNTSGSTDLRVHNLGGSGAPTSNGIKVVDVGGASNGTFALLGDYVFHGEQAVIGGAYAYTLQKNGIATPADGDWYLRSSLVNPPPALSGPIYQPGVPLYEAYPQVMFALNNLPTLQQRVGNRYWDGDATAPAAGDQPEHERSVFWSRTEGSYARTTALGSTTLSDTKIGQWSAHTGFDGLLYRNDAGMMVGGLTAHYGLATADIRSLYGDGRINTSGRGIGGTLTWYGATGFYVDSQAQVTFFDSQFKSDLVGRDMARDGGGLGYAFSVETGQRFGMGGPWALTPQAQLIYSAVEADFTDSFGARVSLDGNDRLTGRLGAALDHQQMWRDENGRLSRASLYGVASVYYEFLGGTTVNVAGLNLASGTERTSGGFGLGGSYNWDNDKYSVYGEALIRTAFDDDYSVGGTAGFRMKW